MRALVCEALSDDFSGLAVRQVDTPAPAAGEVLVRVRAAGVNFPDLLITQGQYQLKLAPPFIPGMELAGEIAALGAGVTGWAVGEAVTGGNRQGAFAEYAIVPAEGLRRKPQAMGFSEASAYQAAYLTAHVALVRRANLQPGETLLVHGASGGVGLAAVDVGRLLGATVIATSASDDKLAAILAYGATHGLNVNAGFRQAVKDLTDGRGADVIFDPVGGDVFDESTRCIAFDGRLLVIGFTSGRIADIATNIPLIKGFSVVGVRAGEYGRRFPERGRDNLDTIWGWAEAGRVSPQIHSEWPLDCWADAYRLLTARKVIGKTVIRADL